VQRQWIIDEEELQKVLYSFINRYTYRMVRAINLQITAFQEGRRKDIDLAEALLPERKEDVDYIFGRALAEFNIKKKPYGNT